jgi:hypothetical protein
LKAVALAICGQNHLLLAAEPSGGLSALYYQISAGSI